jgi:hypothetical protein
MNRNQQSGIVHVVGLVIITAAIVLAWSMSHYSEQISFLRQEEFTSQQRISELEARIRVLETRALQEKIHEPIKLQP